MNYTLVWYLYLSANIDLLTLLQAFIINHIISFVKGKYRILICQKDSDTEKLFFNQLENLNVSSYFRPKLLPIYNILVSQSIFCNSI